MDYAVQFQKTDVEDARKHTFWINADSKRSLESSYEEIAEVLGDRQLPDRMSLPSSVKFWLENSKNGRWILVFDGLGSEEVATEIKALLPSSENGQILVTARDHGWIARMCEEVENWDCMEMKPPNLELSYDIFRRYLQPQYDDEDLGGTRELLRTLWLPQVIKMAANYMNITRTSSKTMRQDLKTYGFHTIVQILFFSYMYQQSTLPFAESLVELQHFLVWP
jgi:hypothetical protein